MGRIGILSGLVRATPAVAVAQTALFFNKVNNEAGGDIRFYFDGANLISRYPATYIHRVKHVQQAGYYTIFFHSPNDGTFHNDGSYYGCHPYPYEVGVGPTSSSGEIHHHEISIDGTDTPINYAGLDDNANSTLVTKDRWYTQAIRARIVSGNLVITYWYDLPDTDKVVSYTQAAGNIDPDDSSQALLFGSSPWTALGSANGECLSGYLRGMQHYADDLDIADILTEAANHSVNTPQTAAGLASVWYMNQNPTVADITDKSGEGHNPVWANARRPADWTAP